MRFIYFIIFGFLSSYVYASCNFRNSSKINEYYLSINSTLNCSETLNTSYSHIFDSQCISGIEWVGKPLSYCDNYCCVMFDSVNLKRIHFECTCLTKWRGNIILNNTLLILVGSCPSPTPTSKPSDEYDISVIIFLTIMLSIVLMFILIAILTYKRNSRYNTI